MSGMQLYCWHISSYVYTGMDKVDMYTLITIIICSFGVVCVVLVVSSQW